MPIGEFLTEQLGTEHPLVRPLTKQEKELKVLQEELERRQAESLEGWKRYAEPQVEEAIRLLSEHLPTPEELAKLSKLKPIPHYGDEPIPKEGEEDPHRCSRECWAWLLQPLRYWPSDLIRVYGAQVLFHPLVMEAIRRLSDFSRDPLLLHNPDPVRMMAENLIRKELETVPSSQREAEKRKLLSRAEQEAKRSGLISSRPLMEFGLSAIRSLEPPYRELVLRDETEDRTRSREARAELRKIFQALAGDAVPISKSHRPIRILSDFEERRAKGVPEKKAVAQMARETGSTDAAIRSAIATARRTLGRRKIRPHHRGAYRDRTKS